MIYIETALLILFNSEFTGNIKRWVGGTDNPA